MPKPSRRPKRKRPIEEIPSSVSLEVISLVRQGGRITKKRIIEKTEFDPRASPIIFPDDDVLPAPNFEADPLTPKEMLRDNESEGLVQDAASCSVSVSFIQAPRHHTLTALPGQIGGVDSTSP